jgi:hypothetical protein
MDQNKTTAVDERIAAVIARKAGASSSERFEIVRQDGVEPLRNRVGAGQIDSTVVCSQFKEPEKPRTIKPADQLDANAAKLAPDAIVKVGDRVTIAPSTISGWEARLTRGWTAFDVTLDGKPVKGDQALEALYNSLREIQFAPKGKAK